MAKEKKSGRHGNKDFRNKEERIGIYTLFSVDDEELPDYPQDEPSPITYEDAFYVEQSSILSGNDKKYGEA